MPNAPLRPCLKPGCPTLVRSGRCAQHTPEQSHGWTGDTGRIRGRKLQQLRAELFRREPLCRLCAAKGETAVAVIRDHVVPLAEGGTDDDSNIQPLCQTCSDAKTQAESKRGRVCYN
jgi:5-methylcytosine-specific restriction protein A